MSEIIPAILPESIEDLKEKISALPAEITFIHLDVLEKDIWTDFNKDFEVHLMVDKSEEIFQRWMDRGAKRIITHSLGGWTAKSWAAKSGVEIGLGIELRVSLEEIFALIPQKINFLHLMSIAEIGKPGHPLDERIFDRIKVVRDKFPKVTMSVDGGVNKDNYQKLIDAGIDRLIVGSHFKEVWQNSQMKK